MLAMLADITEITEHMLVDITEAHLHTQTIKVIHLLTAVRTLQEVTPHIAVG